MYKYITGTRKQDMEENKKTEDVPEYFRMESFRREEFLAQIGSFTQVQYQLFHNICDFWDPALDYNQFILKSSKSFLASNNQLELLMSKIKAAHIGLLQYALIEGEIKASRIILCDKDTLPFYYYLAEDYMARHILEHTHPFLTEKSYDDDGISLPPEMITPLDSSMLSPGFAEKQKNPIIIGINRKMKAPILIPSGMMNSFITALINHIRSEAANPTVMENLSRISDQKISELQKDLTKLDPVFWLTICQKLNENKDDLKLRLKGLNPLIFTSSQLLQTYFQNSLNEQKEQNDQNREKRSARDAIINEFRENGSTWTHISLLDDKLSSNEEKWEGFREEFKTSVLIRGEGKEQPELILLNNMLMHRDFLFPYFTNEISNLRNNFIFLYQDQMSDLLRHNRTDKYSQFFSRSNFRSDILTRVKEKDLQLWELLQKPTRVAESAFHYLQNIKGIKSTKRIKDSMAVYFQSDLKDFRKVDSIFQLKLMAIFDKSYKDLGWWGRFILRLTGRYDSYVSMFADSVTDRKSRGSGRSSKKKRSPGKMKDNAVIQAGYSGGRRRSNPDKSYTPREKKKAWAEFDDAINRKK